MLAIFILWDSQKWKIFFEVGCLFCILFSKYLPKQILNRTDYIDAKYGIEWKYPQNCTVNEREWTLNYLKFHSSLECSKEDLI